MKHPLGAPLRPLDLLARPAHGLRLAARALVRVPGTALTAVLTLGVGLSASVVILGILDSAMRPGMPRALGPGPVVLKAISHASDLKR